ncbi:MAG: methylated-DNA--[protein]-cysteine S-methyltransferase [Rehaibacterium terrae]|uniref:methylated-DNA--[protein]-cysteine S-methyltransferase n=1 Tax=Rehaibacterium terrae TaxID=1341696 RepID=UPI00391CECC0
MSQAAAHLSNDPVEQARRLLDRDDHSLQQLADAIGIGPHALLRRFRARFGLTPAEYRAQRRLQAFKRGLRAGADVTTALYDAGFGSPSRIYENGAARLGMTPARYRRGGEGETLRWTVIDTRLGHALIAVTARGVCAVSLGEDETTLEAELRAEFPHATLERVDAGADEFVAPRVRAVAEALQGRRLHGQLPLEVVGSAFQHKVWQALMRIPPGQTRSYGEIAAAIGAPRAVRAVARACAQNRLAVLVPCHRVIRSDGSLGGYRWGLPRKQALLAAEKADV